jgi:hypothetical protein
MSDLSDVPEVLDLPVVAHVEADNRVVINRGAEGGIRMGQRFLIYGIGKEIVDPVTKRSLGKLELVRGTGKVTHLQAKMAVVDSDMTVAGRRTIKKPDRSGLSGISGYSAYSYFAQSYIEEEHEPPVPIDFRDAEVGDFAKPI